MNERILLCTVGGSHEPILSAIRANSPDYVCFLCTGPDPATGKRGSMEQVTGQGPVIRAERRGEAQTLPNIPTQVGLDEGCFEARAVPADDLDGAFFVIRSAIVELARRFPDGGLVADYTGGTKTMTAALVCAVLEAAHVELQLVTGARTTLDRVESGEQAVSASVTRLRLQHEMARYLDAWSRFGYREAEQGLNGIRVAADSVDGPRLNQARALSRALAEWDDFDHAEALRSIEPYGGLVASAYPRLLPTLRLLAQEESAAGRQREPARLVDLWLNAERRAARGRFDDAIARWYRLLEWTAQWQLRTALRADTADFPRDLLPPEVDAIPGRDGKIRVGLWQAWQVVGCRLSGPAQELAVGQGAALRDLLDLRNRSILAHGFRPVSAADWRRVHSWTEEQFLPVLCALARDAGLRYMPQQLPTEPPESILGTEDARRA